MSTACTLRRAADALEQAASNATRGPWSARAHYDEDDNPEQWCHTDILFHPKSPIFGGVPQIIGQAEISDEDGKYIALVDPEVGKALAMWLRVAADYNRDMDEQIPGPRTLTALDVARAILREEVQS